MFSLLFAVFFPFVVSYDAPDNAVNVSGLLDAPAGKHGRVFVKDGHFATAKGPIRFNATNLTGPANMPSKEYADRMADRLARFGFNCVRLHFLDCQKGYGSFMQERQRGLLKDGDDPFRYEFDPAQFDRLDYLVVAFKKRGIYVNLNLHVARFMAYLQPELKSKKGLTWLDPAIIESEKKYARDFLTHRNPYTGLTWAEDPVVAMIELNNEDAPFNDCRDLVKDLDAKGVAGLIAKERAYLAGMKKLIRDELKCAAPIAGTQSTYTSIHSQKVLDYLDAHEYWNHPSPVNPKWKVSDEPQVNHPADNCIAWLAPRRTRGYPYTVSEYNNPYPTKYGTEGQLLLHAYGAFQGWDGLFQYTYDNRVDSEPDHVEYFFSMIARTDVLAHLPACATMYLRGDVALAKETVSVVGKMSDYAARYPSQKHPWDDCVDASNGKVKYGDSCFHALEFVLEESGGLNSRGTEHSQLPNLSTSQPHSRVSDTRELEWNVEIESAGYVVCRAPKTKFFTGFIRGREFDLGHGFRLKLGATENDWATVSVFEKEPGRWLLAVTGAARNRRVEGDKWGKGPFEVEGVPGELKVPFAVGRVWALDERGNRRTAVAAAGGAVVFGPQYRTVWYEISAD